MNYGSDDWYDWCIENDRGHLTEAWQLKQKRLKAIADEVSRNRAQEVAETRHLLYTGKEKEARSQLAQRVKKEMNTWDATMLAVLYDKADMAKDRDRVLQRLIDVDWGEEPRDPLCCIAPLLLDFARTGNVDEELHKQILDELAERTGENRIDVEVYDVACGVFLAAMMEKRGDKENAIEKLSDAARLPRMGWDRSLSCCMLRNAEVDPIHIEGREFAGQIKKIKPEPEPKPEKSESSEKKPTP